MNHQRTGKKMKLCGVKIIPISPMDIGDGRRLPLDIVTDSSLLNDPNSAHDENNFQFLETVPPDLDVDMVENQCSICIEGDHNRVDGMEQMLDMFLEMSLSNSYKKCNSFL